MTINPPEELPKGEPIWIYCEGSGQLVNHPDAYDVMGLCVMCGEAVWLDVNGCAHPHERDNTITRDG